MSENLLSDRGALLKYLYEKAKEAEPSIRIEDIECVMEDALENFIKEVKNPPEYFADQSESVRKRILEILLKHFITALLNRSHTFPCDVKEIKKNFEMLIYF